MKRILLFAVALAAMMAAGAQLAAGTWSVRQWLDGKSFEFQYNYGKNVLKLYGY